MIRPIMKDPIFLGRPSQPAKNCPEDLQTARDLLETLEAHREGCVGMAANMIGVAKRIIAFDNEGTYMVMFNPVIVKSSSPYEAEEGCLSLTGVRKCTRYRDIEVSYLDASFMPRRQKYSNWIAQGIHT